MKSPARPEWPTVTDRSTPTSTRPDSTYKSGKVVQTNGTTSVLSSAKDVVYGFIGAPAAFNHDKLKQLIFSTGATENKFESIFDILLWFGFLGIIDTNGEAAYIYTYRYDMKLFLAAIRKLEQDGLAYQVNPAFWAALGIGR